MKWVIFYFKEYGGLMDKFRKLAKMYRTRTICAHTFLENAFRLVAPHWGCSDGSRDFVSTSPTGKAKANTCETSSVLGVPFYNSPFCHTSFLMRIADNIFCILVVVCLRVQLAASFGVHSISPPFRQVPATIRSIAAMSASTTDTEKIPAETCSPFGSYPNLLDISDADRAQFHPVVKFPSLKDGKFPPIIDFTKPRPNAVELATEEQRQASAASNGSLDFLPPDVRERLQIRDDNTYFIGRYDENRVGLYESEMFDDTTNDVGGFAGQRTVHMGLDLDGPVGTPVYAFCKGKVHCVGNNLALGDYGNVIVVEHELPATTTKAATAPSPRLLYALYGHLDDSVPKNFKNGDTVEAGQCLGYFGAIHENGGWFVPHVHFQLSINPPVTHDMPGVVAMEDRPRALLEYPDPRLVLGEAF